MNEPGTRPFNVDRMRRQLRSIGAPRLFADDAAKMRRPSTATGCWDVSPRIFDDGQVEWCALERGHDGPHQGPRWFGVESLRWWATPVGDRGPQ